LAGSLGVMVLAIALVAAWRRRFAVAAVLLAAVFAAVGVVMYMRGEHVVSSCLSALAIALPLLAAATLDRPGAWKVGVAVLAVIIFQAMLGMWTVTLLLKPIVVMGHLLGGLATFALLAWAALRWWRVGTPDDRFARLRGPVALGIAVLVGQIALGGWTSSNYAALACGTDFPKCLGQWWPQTDFGQAFVLWRGVGVNYEGGVLDMAARSAIQIAHRIGALVTFCYLAWLSHRLARAGLRKVGIAVAVVLVAQVLLGIGNVHLGLPLPVATAHNGVAALLLFTLLTALASTQRLPVSESP
ncbi:MAG: COX15/CtaA family protein, partial [Luteibacter jiangsuensis]